MELVILDGQMAGTRFQLGGPVLTIGRRSDNDICLPLDPRISRLHARLTHKSDETWIIEDLGSVNGTFVGQRRINAPTALHLDDRFRMGRTWMTLQKPLQDAVQNEALQSIRLDDADSRPLHPDSVVYSVAAGSPAQEKTGETSPHLHLQV